MNDIDTIAVYKLLKSLSTPITETAAYELGLVSADGRGLRAPKNSREAVVYEYVDRLSLGLRGILNEQPAHQASRATYAAMLIMMRERDDSLLDPTRLRSQLVAEMRKIARFNLPDFSDLREAARAIKKIRSSSRDPRKSLTKFLKDREQWATMFKKPTAPVKEELRTKTKTNKYTIGSTNTSPIGAANEIRYHVFDPKGRIVKTTWIKKNAQKHADKLNGITEDAPANAVGGGAIHGVGVGPKGEPGVRPMATLRRKRPVDLPKQGSSLIRQPKQAVEAATPRVTDVRTGRPVPMVHYKALGKKVPVGKSSSSRGNGGDGGNGGEEYLHLSEKPRRR